MCSETATALPTHQHRGTRLQTGQQEKLPLTPRKTVSFLETSGKLLDMLGD